MAQRLGMVMATAGLTPAFRAVPDSMTAQRHLGFRPMARTCAQQDGGTAARGSCVAAAHGASLSATWSTGVRPHSPAPCAVSIPARPATRSIAMTQMHLVAWSSIALIMPLPGSALDNTLLPSLHCTEMNSDDLLSAV